MSVILTDEVPLSHIDTVLKVDRADLTESPLRKMLALKLDCLGVGFLDDTDRDRSAREENIHVLSASASIKRVDIRGVESDGDLGHGGKLVKGSAAGGCDVWKEKSLGIQNCRARVDLNGAHFLVLVPQLTGCP